TQKIIWSEVLPNCWGPIIVQASLGFSDAILEIAALGFLGLGAQPPTAEWGAMLADSRAFIASEPQLMILPGLCILVTVSSFNLPYAGVVRTVVRELSFGVAAGETLGVVGESGCGKSLTNLALMGLLPEHARVSAERLELCGRNLLTPTNVGDWRKVRGRCAA